MPLLLFTVVAGLGLSYAFHYIADNHEKIEELSRKERS
jgi:hypothetical protein